MKVLVTGATGQLGHDVCQELLRRGIEYISPSSKEMDVACLLYTSDAADD